VLSVCERVIRVSVCERVNRVSEGGC
jgi:hypothetical protein